MPPRGLQFGWPSATRRKRWIKVSISTRLSIDLCAELGQLFLLLTGTQPPEDTADVTAQLTEVLAEKTAAEVAEANQAVSTAKREIEEAEAAEAKARKEREEAERAEKEMKEAGQLVEELRGSGNRAALAEAMADYEMKKFIYEKELREAMEAAEIAFRERNEADAAQRAAGKELIEAQGFSAIKASASAVPEWSEMAANLVETIEAETDLNEKLALLLRLPPLYIKVFGSLYY